jgi:signal transduction histidine kinase
MEPRNCFVLLQHREDSEYNDFIGRFYHFPQKYFNQLSKENIEFIYYEPKKRGEGVYFGTGKIGKVFSDKRESDQFFAEIIDYRPFTIPVPFLDNAGERRENGLGYNVQNSVRSISPNTLDEICLDGGVQLSFKADAHLVQVLGEQLIASERVGILELVKNAFDAGATYCNVTIEKVPKLIDMPLSSYTYGELEGPIIIIDDDGHGMTMEQIELGWLRPASIIKTNVKERIKRERDIAVSEGKLDTYDNFIDVLKTANKGRIPLGEKGVGRFAAHRLGRKLKIITKVSENSYEYVLDINWDDFNIIGGKHKDLDSVGIALFRQAPSRDYGEVNSGTRMIIYGGRDGFELTPEEINEINRTILKLNSPNPNPKNDVQVFKATFRCPQLGQLDEKIDYLKYDPVFSIYGIVDEWGIFNYDYTFTPPYSIPLPPFNHKDQTLDLKTLDKKTWLTEYEGRRLWRKPVCGSFYIHIDVWYRDTPWVDKSDRDFLNYLKRYGGISVYRDGINVFTAEWGAESDWLGLRQRQIQQNYRMSYYHLIGNVEIEQSNNLLLIDKTNREGMLANRAFKDLSDLVKSVSYFVEQDYIGKRNDYNQMIGEVVREPRTLNKFSAQSSKLIDNISKNYPIASDPYKLLVDLGSISEREGKIVQLSKSLKNLEENLKQIQDVQDMLTEQAGFGLGIAVALHEISKTTSSFYHSVLEIIESGQIDQIKLEEIRDTSLALENEIARLSPLRSLRNETPVQFNISKSISFVKTLFKRKFRKLNIEFSYNTDQDFTIVAKYGAMNQILTNLFDNACYWMDNPNVLIKNLQVKVDARNRTLTVADSGSGIADSALPYLFQPGYSLKFPPSGLGLYVCKHYLNLMKRRGDIYLANERDKIPKLNGAQFLLDFSKVDSE